MPKPFFFHSRTLFKTIAAAGCAAFLCASSGCRSGSHYYPGRQSVARTVSHETSSTRQQSYDSPVVEEASPSPVDPNAPSQIPLTEDAVLEIFRQSGGKLRPNESGAIVEIDLSFSDITDLQLSEITVFSEVADLDLTGADIHDSGLTALCRLSHLRSVKLKGTKITSEGLRLLSQVPTLILIDASSTAVTDEGLVDAGEWINLRYLSMNNTAVSDAGLQHLAALQNLKGLSVINTAVTETGVLTLKKSLPDCLIVAQTESKSLGAIPTDSLPRLPDLPAPDSTISGTAPARQLDQIVALAGCQPHLAIHLSKIYSTSERWPEATQVLESAVAAAPDDLELHAALGEALARSGRPEDALGHYERCAGAADAKYRVGVIMYERTLKKCERYFDDILRTDPSLSAAHLRRDRIQQELASLRQRQNERVSSETAEIVPEIVPAPSVRNASSSRPLPLR